MAEPIFTLADVVVLCLCLCTLAMLIGADWTALAVAILLPAMIVGTASVEGRCAARPITRRLECWGFDRSKSPIKP